MLHIKCPYCGLRAQKEFAYGGDATVKRPELNKEVSSEEWNNFVYMRKSPWTFSHVNKIVPFFRRYFFI